MDKKLIEQLLKDNIEIKKAILILIEKIESLENKNIIHNHYHYQNDNPFLGNQVYCGHNSVEPILQTSPSTSCGYKENINISNINTEANF